MSDLPCLVVRADGGGQFGVGHLARGLALAQAWIDRQGRVVLVTEDGPDFWVRRFAAEGCTIVDPRTAPQGADWWSVDGYHLNGAASAPSAVPVLVIDDHDGARTAGMGARVVVDQNLGSDPGVYRCAGLVLAGPRYALLRREVTFVRKARPTPEDARQLVVVMGGSPNSKVRALRDAVVSDVRLKRLDIEVLRGADDVATALVTADLALAAAGSVSWELCCHGVPAVLTALVPNQEPVVRALAQAGAAAEAGPSADSIVRALLALAGDPVRRAAMSSVGRSLVDGHGARRVVCRMRSALLKLRDAAEVDAQLLFDWSNDPVTRAASFSSSPIVWEEHLAWLRSRMSESSTGTYVATDVEGNKVGLVRFDEVAQGVAEIGITVAPSRRGQGWGGALVDVGCERWMGERGPTRVEARIKAGNQASVRAFLDADFDLAGRGSNDELLYHRQLDGDPQELLR